MPVVTCPSCRVKFTSSGAPGVCCPTCGQRIGGSPGGPAAPPPRRSAAPASIDRPSRRSRPDDDDYDDDDYDDRPVRRKKKKADGSKTVVYVLIGGGVLALVGVLGVCLVGAYLASVAGERDVARRQPFAPLPQQPLAPAPNVPPPNIPPPRGPVPPPPPAPPGNAPPPAAGPPSVTLSNLRRGRFGNEIEVDYQYVNNAFRGHFDVLMVRIGNETTEVTLIGPPQASGTIQVQLFGLAGRAGGRIDVWMARKPPGPRGNGTPISNTLTMN